LKSGRHEAAFKVIKERGIAVLVAESPGPSAANYRLNDAREVKRFLELLIKILGGKKQ
jgi:hypothetical protein